ncbi:MAG: hypothetical protein M3N38_04160 [Pseudomonadota bacterium]|nr:hypothetical protein [Pseudomonadota bacterium]
MGSAIAKSDITRAVHRAAQDSHRAGVMDKRTISDRTVGRDNLNGAHAFSRREFVRRRIVELSHGGIRGVVILVAGAVIDEQRVTAL